MGTPVKGPEAAGNFIMALCRDLAGNVWVGTEDRGVLRGTPDGAWTQFTTKDGLGDDNGYALCCDRLGRIWVGQLNHGVSVFNGETWKTYDVLDGPLGERGFDIACCPTDGDVWLATSAGLSRYSEKTDRWSYFTRADGLPSDQANALAFAPDGTLYVGMQCDGVAISKPDDNYAKWQLVSAVDSDDASRRPTGKGLPSNLINDVLVAEDGTVYVGTSLGLGKSTDQGKTWEYLRGRDYADKVKGRLEPPPKNWSPLPKEKLATLLPEDYITCLAEDDAGWLWMGFRSVGVAAVNPADKSSQHFPPTKDQSPVDYTVCILPMTEGRPYFGGYGHGLFHLNDAGEKPKSASVALEPGAKPKTVEIPIHPRPAVASTEMELRDFTRRVMALDDALPQPGGAFVDDDRATRGDWVGRYGRCFGLLCAVAAPLDHDFTYPTHYRVEGSTGPHGARDESLRRWCDGIKTRDPRTLYNPQLGYRRQASWDDHGETYSMTHEGPDVWIGVEVHEGTHRVALYFVNNNGHDGANRFRDYVIELKPFAANGRAAERAPTLARTRTGPFWGGVYKSFIVRGPAKYLFKIDRNSSFNTMVSGVFIDQLTGPPWPYANEALDWMGRYPYNPPAANAYEAWHQPAELQAAMELWSALDRAVDRRGAADMDHTCRLLAYRTARTAKATDGTLGNWRWRMRYWTDWDRALFRTNMQGGWQSFWETARNPKKYYQQFEW